MLPKVSADRLRNLCPAFAVPPILAGYRGSIAHGTFIPHGDEHSTDDVDLFTVYARHHEYYLSMSSLYSQDELSFNSNGEHIDIEGHELRKYIYLLSKGNPNVHSYLWLPEDEEALESDLYIIGSDAGYSMLDYRELVLHQGIITSLMGYAYAQAQRMQKMQMAGYMGEKRKELFHQYGYDIKNAAHCVRLLHVGILLLDTGKFYVRLPEDQLAEVMEIKRGQVKVGAATRQIESLFATLQTLEKEKPLQPCPPRSFWDEMCYDILSIHLSD